MTLQLTDVKPVRDEGTIIVCEGVDVETDDLVLFGADRRMAEAFFDDEFDELVAVEEYAVLNRVPSSARFHIT